VLEVSTESSRRVWRDDGGSDERDGTLLLSGLSQERGRPVLLLTVMRRRRIDTDTWSVRLMPVTRRQGRDRRRFGACAYTEHCHGRQAGEQEHEQHVDEARHANTECRV
jgi:hypothetical protein